MVCRRAKRDGHSLQERRPAVSLDQLHEETIGVAKDDGTSFPCRSGDFSTGALPVVIIGALAFFAFATSKERIDVADVKHDAARAGVRV